MKWLCAFILAAILMTPVLAGCGRGEPSPNEAEKSSLKEKPMPPPKPTKGPDGEPVH